MVTIGISCNSLEWLDHLTAPCGTSPLLAENVSTRGPVPVYKVLLSWYRYARKLATCYYTRSPYCCCVATIVHTGDQLPDPRLVSRALISREARVSHFAPRETTLPPRASDCPIPTNGRPIPPNSPGSRSHPNTLPVRRCAMQHDDKPIGRQLMTLTFNFC